MAQPFINVTSKTGTSDGKGFINMLMSRIPFSYNIIDSITALNPKYDVFRELIRDKETRLTQQSVFKMQAGMDLEDGLGSILVNKSFQQLLYSNVEFDKIKRLQEYRRMSQYSELANCIDIIKNKIIFKDDNKKIIHLDLSEAEEKKDISKIIKDEIEKEWATFIQNFDLELKGKDYFRDLIIDGELFFEHIISQEHPEYGILGLVRIPTELINPIYENTVNDLVQNYILRKPVVNPKTNVVDREDVVVFHKNQVCYIHSNMWNDDKSIKYPFVEYARRPYKQLSLTEDSVVIHRTRMAPERLIFNVDVGNMSGAKAEMFLRKIMQQYWTKKSFDTTTGKTVNIYDPQSYNDSYWFANKAGTNGTKVESLDSKSNLGQLDDLNYYLRKLYRSMRVPTSRINPDYVPKDGVESTAEELDFADFLIDIQTRMAEGIKQSFITHLKLRNIWKTYKIKERYLKIWFSIPTIFMIMKQQQLVELKYNNFNNLSQNEGISNSFAQKEWLGLSEEKMASNREWRRKDAVLQWELEQILANGPNWKEQQQALQSAASEIQGGGGTAGGGASASGSEIPEFGPAAGGETPAPEGGAAGGSSATPAPAPSDVNTPPPAPKTSGSPTTPQG